MTTYPRIDFEKLLQLQDVLDMRLVEGSLSYSEYEREWSQLLDATGYTNESYAAAVDKRCDFLNLIK